MNIGITFNSTRNIWSSGASQMLYFLGDLLKRNGVNCTFLINDGMPPFLKRNFRCVHLDKVADIKSLNLNYLIVGDLIPELSLLSEILSSPTQKTKCIYFNLENKFFTDTEDILFSSPANNTPVSRVSNEISFIFDEVWLLPHLSYQKSYLESIFTNKPIKEVPYLWDSYFINNTLSKSQKEKLLYTGESPPITRACIFEPNANIIKNCIIPLFICNSAYIHPKSKLKSVNIFNCKKLRTTPRFNNLINHTQIVKDKVVYFNNRWCVLDALQRWQGAVVTHQTLNELTNLYFETLYLGLPLIHNSPMIEEYGYYYNDFDLEKGATQLVYSLLFHQENLDYYKGSAKECLHTYSSYNPQNIEKYKTLL
tara:strand:+ start:13207 stop:14307 length:1101 start_codon:yes stop_codon:yes gene_type:complete